jgi:hypothetical protein
MPLEATHIRFALDLKKRYPVQNLTEYIAGSIYPDSRYVSKLGRLLTHSDDCLDSSFANTDFTMGWQSHLYCDLLFNKAKKEMFAEIAFAPDYRDDDWIISTAIKILLDIDDCSHLDVGEYLDCLDYSTNPNNEDIGLVKRYNRIIKDFYSREPIPVIRAYGPILESFGIQKTLVDSVIATTESFDTDLASREKISRLYQRMLELATEGD